MPNWWLDDAGQSPGLDISNGFASENGTNSDWNTAPTGNRMTIPEAEFLNEVKGVFRIGAGSAAVGQASDGGDQGYYTYHEPVYVDATYCADC